MSLTPLLLSRIQFAFTISYHIIYPSFTIGIAAWMCLLEGMSLVTGKPVYRRLFDFWLRIFGVAFGLGVISGIVMAFEFGTNWSRLSQASGAIQGPLLAYESFTAFALEASFFGVLIFGRSRVSPRVFLFSTLMVALGTTLSAFWIMVNNSWMQAPVAYVMTNGAYAPTSWAAIVFSPVVWVRFPHMLLAAYISGAFCVAATGAWYRLRGAYEAESQTMLGMGLALAALLIPVQLLLGHSNGDYIHERQPAKFAAIEARWHDEQPASEVIIAWPDGNAEVNRFEIKVPVLGSLIATGNPHSREVGLKDFPRADRPPVAIPFFTFRVMVGCGLVMAAIAWMGILLNLRDSLDRHPGFLWATFLSFPLPFIATLSGWFTAEVGRQPWTVYGVLRTADAVTPSLTVSQTLSSLVAFVLVHSFIFGFGTFYIYRLLLAGPAAGLPPPTTNPKRPLSLAGVGRTGLIQTPGQSK
jgi:cytochrome d ubiquinol oxidase subunit I